MIEYTAWPLAQAAAPAGPGGFTPVGFFGWIAIMIAIFYFMIIRPQNRREKERRALIASVKSGQRVLFGGGILGTVTNVKDKTLMVKIADNVKVEITKGAVSTVLQKGDSVEDPAA